MRPIFTLAFVVYILPSAASAADWRWAGGAADHSTITFIDVASIREVGSRTIFWQEMRYKSPRSNGATRSLAYLSVNCQTFDYEDIQITSYKNGEVVGSDERFPKSFAPPESIMYYMIDAVCKRTFVGKTIPDRDAFASAFFQLKE